MDGRAMERQIDIQMDKEREHREMDGSKDARGWIKRWMEAFFLIKRVWHKKEMDNVPGK